jgi:hypothetical protein
MGAREPIEKITLLDGRVKAPNVTAVLTNVKTGEKRVYKAGNIVTNDGDHYYAHAAAKGILGVEALLFTGTIGIALGYNAGSPSAPAKTDVALGETTGSTEFEFKAIDSGYPKTNDPDTNNPGAAVDTISWRTSFTTAEGNHTDIATLALGEDSLNHLICVANFGAKFDKTTADTLQVYVNHNVLGA